MSIRSLFLVSLFTMMPALASAQDAMAPDMEAMEKIDSRMQDYLHNLIVQQMTASIDAKLKELQAAQR